MQSTMQTGFIYIKNSDFATTLSDPDRLSVPNFCKIRRETAEELANINAPEAARRCLFSYLVYRKFPNKGAGRVGKEMVE